MNLVTSTLAPRNNKTFITLPGIGGSGPTHWQTRWEASDPAFTRFSPQSWSAPHLVDWIAALDRAVELSYRPPILVAHSLACLLVAHWAARSACPIGGALLVSVPDPKGSRFPSEATEFREIPDQGLRFPSLILASCDDPYADLKAVRELAGRWGSSVIELGALGHINAASSLGDWQQGRWLLSAFAAGIV
jgi:predicted alpha/beta hydrolase family esterase